MCLRRSVSSTYSQPTAWARLTGKRYEARLGKTVRALVDRVDDEAIQARVVWQADDIDGVTYAHSAPGIEPGTFVDVTLDEVLEDVDFGATIVRIVSEPAKAPKQGRALPMFANNGSIGSFGR